MDFAAVTRLRCGMASDDQKASDRGFVVRPAQPEWGTDDDTSLHVVLVCPEIPGNTGSIGRLCAGANIWLHLVRPLGFELDNRYLKRAGLDYWPHVKLCVHETFDDVLATFPRDRVYLFTKKARRSYTDAKYTNGSVLVFGRETRGLDEDLLHRLDDRTVTIPITGKIRSLNLANAASIAVYEALRQLDFGPLSE